METLTLLGTVMYSVRVCVCVCQSLLRSWGLFVGQKKVNVTFPLGLQRSDCRGRADSVAVCKGWKGRSALFVSLYLFTSRSLSLLYVTNPLSHSDLVIATKIGDVLMTGYINVHSLKGEKLFFINRKSLCSKSCFIHLVKTVSFKIWKHLNWSFSPNEKQILFRYVHFSVSLNLIWSVARFPSPPSQSRGRRQLQSTLMILFTLVSLSHTHTHTHTGSPWCWFVFLF